MNFLADQPVARTRRFNGSTMWGFKFALSEYNFRSFARHASKCHGVKLRFERVCFFLIVKGRLRAVMSALLPSGEHCVHGRANLPLSNLGSGSVSRIHPRRNIEDAEHQYRRNRRSRALAHVRGLLANRCGRRQRRRYPPSARSVYLDSFGGIPEVCSFCSC